MPQLQLYGSVGPEKENDADDVANVSHSLAELGLPGARDAALSGAWDNRFDATVKSFQADSGLDVDGVLLPGGPTQVAINHSLEAMRSKVPEPPTRMTKSSPARDEAKDFSASSLASSRSPMFGDNAFASSSHAPYSPARGEEWWRGDPDLPRISEHAAQAIANGARQREAQFDNFLKLIGAPRSASATAAHPDSPAADPDEAERILTGRGYRYVPDPMGRIGWGDWVDATGVLLDPANKQAILMRETASRLASIGRNDVRQERSPASSRPGTDSEIAGVTDQWVHLDDAQAAIFAKSEYGSRVANALNQLTEAVGEDGAVPAALWRDELRRLGIEPGQIGAQSSNVTLVTNPNDRERSGSGEDRSPRSFLGKAWSWLTEDFPGLAEQMAQAIARLDDEIRAIESEPGWRRNILSLVARQSLLEARTGIIGGYPTSRLDFIFAGIDVVGVGMVSGRPLLILKKGSKVITSADLAEGGFRSRHAIDLGKDVPYNSHSIRAWMEQRYGAGSVESLTVPRADYHLIQLAGRRHPVTGIVFDAKGFPIFDDVAKFDTRLPSEVFWKSAADTHKRLATRQLADAIRRGQVDARVFDAGQLSEIMKGAREIPGFTWHHHQDLGRMQLVPDKIHKRTLHIGGEGMKGGK